MADKKESTGSSSFASSGGAQTNDSVSLPLADGKQLAGESSDPAVHKLLADRQALQMNRDTLDPPVDKDALKAIDDRIAEVDKQLAELGYTA